MSRKIQLIIVSVFIIASFSLISCNDSFQTIFDDLNEKCQLTVPEKSISSVNDVNFNPDSMLPKEVYAFYEDSIFIMQGPKDAATYKWQIKVPKTKKHPEQTYTICESSLLNYELPGVLEPTLENELIFVVTTSDNKELIDKAKIVLISR